MWLRPMALSALAACAWHAACASAAADPSDGVYEGTIGTAKIVASFDRSTGKYFYASKGLDIFLDIKAKGNALIVAEKGGDDDAKVAPTGIWNVTLNGTVLSGTWSPPKGGKTIPISLTRVAPVELDASDPTSVVYGPATTPYEWRWLAARESFAPGPEVSVGGYSYQMMRDSSFGLRAPRLVKFPNPAQKDAANRALEQIQYHMIFDLISNANDSREAVAADANRSVNAVTELGSNTQDAPQVTTLGSTALSFVVTGMWDGGGAHPNMYVAAYTVDLARGVAVDNASLPMDPPPKTLFGGAIDVGTPAKLAAFDSLWTTKLRRSVASLAAAAAKKKDTDDQSPDEECAADIAGDDFAQDGAANYILYLKNGGLAVHPDGWPNVAAYCFTSFAPVPVVLTPADLKPFLVPGQHLIGVQ